MSIFASVAIVCTMSLCNNYHIDTADSLDDGVKNTETHQKTLQAAMPVEKELNDWLVRHQIGETVFEIVSIEIETHEVHSDDNP